MPQHIVTANFPEFIGGKLLSSTTFLTTIDHPVRFIIEVIDIECESGHIIISEGNDKSQKICKTEIQYPNVVARKNNIKLTVQIFCRLKS